MSRSRPPLAWCASVLLAACGAVPVAPSTVPPPTALPSALAAARSPSVVPPVPVERPRSLAPPLPAERIERSAPPGTARLRAAALVETSGLALSRRDDGVLWAINDSGNAPALHALDRDGRALGTWPVAAANRDWEDLAASRLDGVPYLLIADTGDNGRRRDDVVLHLVAEPLARGPDAAPGTTLVPSRSLRFRYEDGAHDVEAVAVDEPSATVWLLTKEPARGGRGIAGGVYTLSLAEGADPVARRVATLAAVGRGLEARLAATLAGVDLEQPTAFDIAADGATACLLTYRRLRCFERADGEDWSETLARSGRALAPHRLDQAEALALAADGRTVWFTSEGISAPLRTRRLR